MPVARPTLRPRANCRTPCSNPNTARILSSGKRRARVRRGDLPSNSPLEKMACRAMARTKACAFRQPWRSHRLFPHTSPIPFPTTGDRSHARAHPFDEWLPPLCRRSSPARCRFYREAAGEAPATSRGKRPLGPYRIARSRAACCPPAQWRGGRSSSALRAAIGSPCARKTFLCAHKDRSRNVPSRSHGPP